MTKKEKKYYRLAFYGIIIGIVVWSIEAALEVNCAALKYRACDSRWKTHQQYKRCIKQLLTKVVTSSDGWQRPSSIMQYTINLLIKFHTFNSITQHQA